MGMYSKAEIQEMLLSRGKKVPYEMQGHQWTPLKHVGV